MIATKDDVLAIAPCFSSLDDPTWATHLALAGQFVGDDAWGDDPARAVYPQALFVAHHLALVFPALAGDDFLVTSERVGAISRSYAVPTLDPSMLAVTRWGAQYLALMRTIPTFLVV